MHKILFAALLMCSTAAFAEEGALPAGGPGGDGKAMERRGPGGEDGPKMDFATMKQKALERHAQRKAKKLEQMAKVEACINASTDPESLKACIPHRKGGHGGKGGWRGKRGGEDGGPRGGSEGPGGED